MDFLNIWHLWLLVPSHHDMTQLSNIFQHRNKLQKKLIMAESLFMWEEKEVRVVYILSPNVFFESSRFIISPLLPKQPWPIKVCWRCATFSSTKDALLGSMKWCCCYLPDRLHLETFLLLLRSMVSPALQWESKDWPFKGQRPLSCTLNCLAKSDILLTGDFAIREFC